MDELELFAEAPSEFLHDTGRFGTVRVLSRACPLCDAEDGLPLHGYGKEIWRLCECRRCAFVYLDRAPDYEALFSAMAWEKTTIAEVERRAELRPVSHRLSKLTRARMRLLPRKTMPSLVARHAKPGKVIDLGCGTGTQLAGLSSVYVPYGIEISREAAAAAHDNFAARGGKALNAPSLDGLRCFAAGFFTAATLRSYLEHELHPRAVLRELRRTLAPGGVAIVKVPNYASLNRRIVRRKWCGFRYPDHLNYFTPASLTRLAGLCGYRVRFGLTDRLPTSDNMYAVMQAA
ncbi:MAG TPA: class I SAM-dependent methyltransferase [Stellaceae bacterium]|nr:class I SAM-dependent methyltransferase [Stellaceae bacterium]